MASTTIGTAFVKQYGSTLDLLLQTQGGKFEGKCLEETIVGEEKYYEQLGSVYANEVIDRYGDSPRNDITHARRRVTATPYDVGIEFDNFDAVQTLINPEGQYVQQMATALRRKKDIEFISGALGTAYSGKGGGTSNVLADVNCVDTGHEAGATLTVERLLKTKSLLESNNVDLDDPMNKPYMVVTPEILNAFMFQTEVKSADYNTVKALAAGDINTYMGFEFIRTNLLPYTTDDENETVDLTWSAADVPVTGAGNVRACFAYVKSGVRMVTNPALTTRVTELPEHRFNWYGYAKLRCGAVRMEEDKVVIVGCDEDAALSD